MFFQSSLSFGTRTSWTLWPVIASSLKTTSASPLRSYTASMKRPFGRTISVGSMPVRRIATTSTGILSDVWAAEGTSEIGDGEAEPVVVEVLLARMGDFTTRLITPFVRIAINAIADTIAMDAHPSRPALLASAVPFAAGFLELMPFISLQPPLMSTISIAAWLFTSPPRQTDRFLASAELSRNQGTYNPSQSPASGLSPGAPNGTVMSGAPVVLMFLKKN